MENVIEDALTPEETAKAKELGLIKDEEQETQEPENIEVEGEENAEEQTTSLSEETDEEDDNQQSEDSEPKEEVKPDNIEQIQREKRAMYNEMKEERRKRQEMEEKMAAFEQKVFANNTTEQRIQKALALLGNENVTVDQLQEALVGGDKDATPKEDDPMTIGAFKKIQEEQQKQQLAQQQEQTKLFDRYKSVLSDGQQLNNNFVEIVKAVNEFTQLSENQIYDKIITTALRDKNISPYEAAQQIVQIARLTPKGASLLEGNTQAKSTSSKTDADRAIENAQKSPSTASVSGTGSRKISLDNITPEQLAKMPPEQYRQARKKLGKTKITKLLNFDKF